jgi:ribosome maturation factor RimP
MRLKELLETRLGSLGYELVDVVVANRGRFIQLFIDKAGGMTLEDCAQVSNYLTRVLAVEMNLDYDRLEVSSPGLDRPLKKEGDFLRFRGAKARVKMRLPINGQRNFVGILRDVHGGILQLEVDGVLYSLELANVEKVRLVPAI